MADATKFEPVSYTVNDACAALGVGRTSLYRLISERKVDARRVAGRTVITAASMQALLENAEAV